VKHNRSFAWVLVFPMTWGCGSDSSMLSASVNDKANVCSGSNCVTTNGATGAGASSRSTGGAPPTLASPPNNPPLIVTSTSVSSTIQVQLNRCAVAAMGCNPDDAKSCANAVAKGMGGASSGDNSVGSGGANHPEGDSAVGGESHESGMGGMSNSSASLVDGGTGGAVSDSSGQSQASSSAPLACRIVMVNSVSTASCESAGSRIDGETCIKQSDCAPGLACTAENGTAKCRQYCCSDDNACRTGTYCAEGVARSAPDAAVGATVWVCMPEESCRFDEPFPCPANQTCSCSSGKTCGVVRSDGTTACVVPGTGLEGDPCSETNRCAAGHVCSNMLGTCVKTCSLTSADDRAVKCATGVCQSSSSLPENVGICVTSSALY
jgi:hypothetical protein